ncbi:MAG: helix-turn-helix domain-containing protein, partial [Subdoligranulum sp.]
MQTQKFPKISLAAARVNAGLNQQEAAKALGVSVATLQNYESGKTVPQWGTVQK